jgi:hypothetical protein
MIGNTDPEFTEHVVDQTDTSEFRLMPFRSPAGVELFEYAQRLADDRRGGPGRRRHEDARPDDGRRTPHRPRVQELLHAHGRRRQRHHPLLDGRWPARAARPPRAARAAPRATGADATAVEEMLRWTSVTMHFRRTATRDVEVHGRRSARATRSCCGGSRATRRAAVRGPVPLRHHPGPRTSTWPSAAADRTGASGSGSPGSRSEVTLEELLPGRVATSVSRARRSGCGPTSSAGSSTCRWR